MPEIVNKDYKINALKKLKGFLKRVFFLKEKNRVQNIYPDAKSPFSFSIDTCAF